MEFFPKNLNFGNTSSVFEWLDLNSTLIENHSKHIEQTLGIIPAKNTLLLYMAAGAKVKVNIGFTPMQEGPESTIIFFRYVKKIIHLLAL